MGLYVHNLGNLPADESRKYFVYVLDYGWHESLSKALQENFTNMARRAAKSKAVVIAGLEPIHFENEVFSYHGISGENGKNVLPAIMVTTLHPTYFKENNRLWRERQVINDKLLIVPLKKCCKTTDDVVNLIHRIFNDIEENKKLIEFSIQKEIKKDKGFRSFVDALIIQPNINGVGIDLKKFFGLKN